MQIRTQLEPLFTQAVENAVAAGALPITDTPPIALERPKDPSNGDWACTLAMRLAKQAHMAPRTIAEAIAANLPESPLIGSVEIAGPGFINVRLSPAALQGVVASVRSAQQDFGKSCAPADSPSHVNLEYVSANPTGPMHVGHGRWAALGDATARVMRHAGYTVYEEFYVNDHGVQMDTFGRSLWIRYQQLLGIEAELPENSYGGSYVVDIAQGIVDADGSKWLDVPEDERHAAFRERGYAAMMASMRGTLERFGNRFNLFFSESSLYVPDENGETAVDRALAAFKAQGYVYENAGATWFKSTAFGDEKDRVLIKADGDTTYFMSDCAYHYDKLQRGFDHLIDIWGADHHGYIKRCEAMLEAWGHPGTLEVMLGQLVNLFRDGEAVRMSKRTGEMVTFEELIDEVGVDATRFLMLSRSSDQPIDFDIEVAKKHDATNPVYYVQYAHARICSILRKAAEAGCAEINGANLGALREPAEMALCNVIDDFTDLVAVAAKDRAPFKLTHYAADLASAFHSFYTECHVLDDDPDVRNARLALCDATRIVLALTLNLLGVSAPERM